MVKEKYRLYTDGSCNNLSPEGEGGYAYVLLQLIDDEYREVERFSTGALHTTNNQMELMAIIEGCKRVPDGAKVQILSDSQYALNVLSGTWKNPKANLELIARHQPDRKRLKISYRWIRGHEGNLYNEIADSLAEAQTVEMRKKYNIPLYDYTNSPKCTHARRYSNGFTRNFGFAQ